MNYLYSESTLGNPVDTVLLFENRIITFHHRTIKVYNHRLELLKSQFFPDKIVSIKKINKSLIVLFTNGKIIQANLELEITALRLCEGDIFRMDSYNTNVVVYNQHRIYSFSEQDKSMKMFLLSDLQIFNIVSIAYCKNYIPTILIASIKSNLPVASIYNLDSVPVLLEEFPTIPNVILVDTSIKFMLLVSPNCIQIKYKRESYVLVINSVYKELDFKNVIFCLNYEIVIERPQIIFKDDLIYLLNGFDGILYKIEIFSDAKKILKAEIISLGFYAKDSFADFNEECFVLGGNEGIRLFHHSLDDNKKESMNDNNIGVYLNDDNIRQCFNDDNVGQYPNGNIRQYLNGNIKQNRNDNNIGQYLNDDKKESMNDNIRLSIDDNNVGQCFNDDNVGQSIDDKKKCMNDNIGQSIDVKKEYMNDKKESMNDNIKQYPNGNIRQYLNDDNIGQLMNDNIGQSVNDKKEFMNDNVGQLMNDKKESIDNTKQTTYDNIGQSGIDKKQSVNDKKESGIDNIKSMNFCKNLENKKINPHFKEVAKLDSIGTVKDFAFKNENTVFLTSKGIYSVNKTLSLKILEKIKLEGNNRDFYLNYSRKYFDRKNCKISENLQVLFDQKNKSLKIIKNGKVLLSSFEIEDYASSDKILCYFTKKSFNIYSLDLLCNIFSCGLCRITNGEKKIESGFDDLVSDRRILEILVKDSYVFVRTDIQLLLYHIDLSNIDATCIDVRDVCEQNVNSNNNSDIESDPINDNKSDNDDDTRKDTKTNNDTNNNNNDKNKNKTKKDTNTKTKKDTNRDTNNDTNNGTNKDSIKDTNNDTRKDTRKDTNKDNNRDTNNDIKNIICLEKQFIDKIVTFKDHSKALFKIQDFIYVKSKIPYFILIKNGVFIYKANLKINYPIQGNTFLNKINFNQPVNEIEEFLEEPINNEFYFAISKNYLYKFEIEKNNCVFDSFILKRESFDFEQIPRKILLGTNFSILVFAKIIEFKFIPFIPMVHTTDSNNKVLTEPINKEESEYVNNNPSVLGRSLEYSIHLCSLDYKIMSTITLNQYELVCDIKIVLDKFLVICTSSPEGEDKSVKGRVIVYLLSDIVPDPNNPHIYKKMKLIGSEIFKASCNCVEEVRGLLSLCVGTKLMLYELSINTGLTAVGRNEISLMTTSLFSTKNFICVSDIFSGLFFFFLRPRDPLKLHLLASSNKIYNLRHLQGLGFGDKDLSLVGFDKCGNIHIYSYDPYENNKTLIRKCLIKTHLDSELYNTSTKRVDSLKSVFYLSNNILINIKIIDVRKIQAVQQCIFLNFNVFKSNYLDEDYVNSECLSAISERVLLEYFYLPVEDQEKIGNLLSVGHAEITHVVESCLL